MRIFVGQEICEAHEECSVTERLTPRIPFYTFRRILRPSLVTDASKKVHSLVPFFGNCGPGDFCARSEYEVARRQAAALGQT
jgi:hypothetical protein